MTVRQSRRVLTAISAYRVRWSLVRFLVDHSLPLRLFAPLSTLYHADAVARLTDNPYRLLAFCDWAVTDRVACQQGVPRTDRRRLEAALVVTLQDTLSAGHTALPRRTLIQRTSQRVKVPSQVVSAVFPTSVVTQAAGDMVQLPGIASQERTIATVCAGRRFLFGEAGIATKMRYAFGLPRSGCQRRPMPDARPTRQQTRR